MNMNIYRVNIHVGSGDKRLQLAVHAYEAALIRKTYTPLFYRDRKPFVTGDKRNATLIWTVTNHS